MPLWQLVIGTFLPKTNHWGWFWDYRFIFSLILPSEFFRVFQGLTKTSLAEWYAYQGYKVEQHVRKSPVLGTEIFILVIGLCLAMHMGDSIVRKDAGLVFRIFRETTYPYLALVVSFRGTGAMSDPWFLNDISNTIKTLIKYPQDKPGKSTAIAVIGGSFALFAYFKRKKEKTRQEAREIGSCKKMKDKSFPPLRIC